MIREPLFHLAMLAVSAPAVAAELSAPADSLCVMNGSGHDHVFAAEAPGAGRKVAKLAPGDTLCVSGAEPGTGGVVSVFEHMDSFEGCSRLVPVGKTEVMRQYVDFDRCFWSSNS